VSKEGANYGIHNSMPIKLAIARCPNVIVVPPRFAVYQKVSQQILGILKEYSPFVEPLELVEAYIEVTDSPKGLTSATLLAKEIKQRILQSTGLICSIGVSNNKFVAKAASSLGKPDGLVVVPPNKVCEFLEQLPIHNFHGISKTTTERFLQRGVKNGLDLKRISELELRQNFGKLGYFLYYLVRGKDNRSIIANREQKSLYAGFTFVHEEKVLNIIEGKLLELTELVTEKLNYLDRGAKCVVVKITNSLFITRSRRLSFATSTINCEDLSRAARFCLLALIQPNESIHRIGVSLTNLAERPKYQQLSIFG
jgi:DNA polymerase-4